MMTLTHNYKKNEIRGRHPLSILALVKDFREIVDKIEQS